MILPEPSVSKILKVHFNFSSTELHVVMFVARTKCCKNSNNFFLQIRYVSYSEFNHSNSIFIKQFENLINENFCSVFWHVIHIYNIFSCQHPIRTDSHKSTVMDMRYQSELFHTMAEERLSPNIWHLILDTFILPFWKLFVAKLFFCIFWIFCVFWPQNTFLTPRNSAFVVVIRLKLFDLSNGFGDL